MKSDSLMLLTYVLYSRLYKFYESMCFFVVCQLFFSNDVTSIRSLIWGFFNLRLAGAGRGQA